MSYAVVDLGGKQYRVEEGSVITVDRLQAEQGSRVALRPVMFRGDDVVLDAKGLEKIKVEATVTEHLRGEKIKVFKYKANSRRAGHRSELTKLKITSLGGGTRKAAAKKETAPKAKTATKADDAKETAKPKAAAKPKAEVKTETKPAAKKPAAKKPGQKPAAEAKADEDQAGC